MCVEGTAELTFAVLFPVTLPEMNMGYLGTLIASYEDRTSRSRVTCTQLESVLPGGETRSVTYSPPYTLVMERGAGAAIWDIDGHRDMSLLLHGVVAAPRGMLGLSTALTEQDLELVADAYGNALTDVAKVMGTRATAVARRAETKEIDQHMPGRATSGGAFRCAPIRNPTRS